MQTLFLPALLLRERERKADRWTIKRYRNRHKTDREKEKEREREKDRERLISFESNRPLHCADTVRRTPPANTHDLLLTNERVIDIRYSTVRKGDINGAACGDAKPRAG